MLASLRAPRGAASATVAVALALLVAAPPTLDAQDPLQGPPPTVDVQITFDAATGAVGVSRDTIRVERPGTRIRWSSDQADWRVTVHRANRIFGGSNDRDRTFRGRRGQANGGVVTAAGPRTSYKYTVRVTYDGEEHVLDPEIIIAF